MFDVPRHMKAAVALVGTFPSPAKLCALSPANSTGIPSSLFKELSIFQSAFVVPLFVPYFANFFSSILILVIALYTSLTSDLIK
jgi:hypothetical protein